MTAIQRITSTALVLAMLMAITVVPAFAAAIGAATITSGDLLSGQPGAVTIRITNGSVDAGTLPGPLGGLNGDTASDIDAIVIEVPATVYSATDVTLPSGWTGEYDTEIGFVYATADGESSELAPGASLDVTIEGAANEIADDTTRAVPVFVSDDGGRTLSSAGVPNLTSRILQVDSIAVVKPGAINQNLSQVTAGQDTATVSVKVTNFGSQARSVTINAAKSSGSSTATVTPQIENIGSGVSFDTAELVTTFGSAGTLGLNGTATSANSAAVAVPADQIAVQQAFSGTYVNDSLSPRTAVQGQSYDFVLQLNKAGVQPANLTTTFSINGVATASGSQPFPAASSTETLEFDNVAIPALAANGSYDTLLTASGVDDNGATVSVTITPQTVTLDNLLPVIELEANVGDPDVTGATPAAGDGRTITFSGTVKVGTGTGTGTGGEVAACTSCTVTAKLVTDLGEELPFTLTNTNGELSGSASFTFEAGTTSASATATAVKDTGLSSTGASDIFEVDIIAPTLASATTGRDDQGDFVNVSLSELADTTNSRPFAWQVDNSAVQSATAQPAENGAVMVQLRLLEGNTFANNATPTVSYSPTGLAGTPFGSRINDRVSLTMLDQVIEAIDGIVPDAPILSSVQGLALQGGKFYTNQFKPTVTVAGMEAGTLLELYFDRNGNEVPENSEVVYSGPVSNATETVTLGNSLGNSDIEHMLIGRLHDGVAFGLQTLEPLVLDRTVPVITAYAQDAQDGSTVVVTFSEMLPLGRDAAFDWTVIADQDGETRSRSVEAVTAGLNARERTLKVAANSYDPADGDVSGVRFKYRGAASDRYSDFATNTLANQTAQ
jgi:hypothetical protein